MVAVLSREEMLQLLVVVWCPRTMLWTLAEVRMLPFDATAWRMLQKPDRDESDVILWQDSITLCCAHLQDDNEDDRPSSGILDNFSQLAPDIDGSQGEMSESERGE
ncbi:hypothetical protein PoB_000681100 [Plakobranchus ocellatus]|uniref:Uncharacterized protein n=1 Tax=Plakobranchus ocellatus TaxID=259542 RepID=A0AAV3YD29_9GAST|nr:hypothetical protein PoB_000681100 [Plakobranchus ocellatus]